MVAAGRWGYIAGHCKSIPCKKKRKGNLPRILGIGFLLGLLFDPPSSFQSTAGPSTGCISPITSSLYMLDHRVDVSRREPQI